MSKTDKVLWCKGVVCYTCHTGKLPETDDQRRTLCMAHIAAVSRVEKNAKDNVQFRTG